MVRTRSGRKRLSLSEKGPEEQNSSSIETPSDKPTEANDNAAIAPVVRKRNLSLSKRSNDVVAHIVIPNDPCLEESNA